MFTSLHELLETTPKKWCCRGSISIKCCPCDCSLKAQIPRKWRVRRRLFRLLYRQISHNITYVFGRNRNFPTVTPLAAAAATATNVAITHSSIYQNNRVKNREIYFQLDTQSLRDETESYSIFKLSRCMHWKLLENKHSAHTEIQRSSRIHSIIHNVRFDRVAFDIAFSWVKFLSAMVVCMCFCVWIEFALRVGGVVWLFNYFWFGYSIWGFVWW